MNINSKVDNSQSTRRIASNTIVLFARMLVLMFVNLYTARLIIKALGLVDYGLFNTIAGVITTSAFISGVLTLSIQRFYSVALGRQDKGELKKVYSASINIALCVCVIIIALFETVGLWFVNSQLNIPTDRMEAVLWVYQFSLITFLCSFIQIPFTSLVFAYEKMGVYALVSTLESLGKLAFAYVTIQIGFDHLCFYSGTLLFVALLVLSTYVVLSHILFKDVRYSNIKDKSIYKQLLSFSGWTIFGSIANTSMIQGGIILINIFFGPIINAAFGVALQINNAVSALVNSMIVPFRPAIQKKYAEGDQEYVSQLFTMSNKFIYYVLTAVSIPLFIKMKWILTCWLGFANDVTVLFCQLMLVYLIVISMHNPITIIIHATGKIRNYHLLTESFTALSLPITWLFYKIGLPSESLFLSMLMVCIRAHIVRIYCIRKVFAYFSLRQYMWEFLIPALIVSIVSYAIFAFLNGFISNQWINLASVLLGAPLCMAILGYMLGLSSNERQLIKKFLTSTVFKHVRNRIK